MENGELHGSRASFKDDHHIDWMNNGDYAVYKIDNRMNASYYDVSFTAGTTQSNVSINFVITNAEGLEVCNEAYEPELFVITERGYGNQHCQHCHKPFVFHVSFSGIYGQRFRIPASFSWMPECPVRRIYG